MNSDTLRLSAIPRVKTGMLIRKPAAEVFEAFADPAVTTRFWFTQGSARLAEGAPVQWDWDMYGISVPIVVRRLEPAKSIVIEFPGQPPTVVEWVFHDRGDGTTFVEITHSGFSGSGDETVAQALDSLGGFALVLAGAKAWLEHGVQLQLVRDRFPKGFGKDNA